MLGTAGACGWKRVSLDSTAIVGRPLNSNPLGEGGRSPTLWLGGASSTEMLGGATAMLGGRGDGCTGDATLIDGALGGDPTLMEGTLGGGRVLIEGVFGGEATDMEGTAGAGDVGREPMAMRGIFGVSSPPKLMTGMSDVTIVGAWGKPWAGVIGVRGELEPFVVGLRDPDPRMLILDMRPVRSSGPSSMIGEGDLRLSPAAAAISPRSKLMLGATPTGGWGRPLFPGPKLPRSRDLTEAFVSERWSRASTARFRGTFEGKPPDFIIWYADGAGVGSAEAPAGFGSARPLPFGMSILLGCGDGGAGEERGSGSCLGGDAGAVSVEFSFPEEASEPPSTQAGGGGGGANLDTDAGGSL